MKLFNRLEAIGHLSHVMRSAAQVKTFVSPCINLFGQCFIFTCEHKHNNVHEPILMTNFELIAVFIKLHHNRESSVTGISKLIFLFDIFSFYWHINMTNQNMIQK